MKSLLYFQSGGPTPVINTSLYGVIKEAKRHQEIDGIYGSLFGIEGVINDNIVDLRQEDDEQLELLKQTPGAILGTTRYKLSDDLGHPDYFKILVTLKKHNIGYLLVNGGNDSMDTCHKLSQFMKKADYECSVVGIPKTIDNDLNYTDHCLGYPSAAKYVVQTLQDIAIDNTCYNKGKVAIVEIMGRNAGWLTAAAALLENDIKPDRIYLPEESFHLDKFLEDIKAIYAEKKKAFIVISEGVAPFLSSAFATVDSFNHAQLGGIANILGDQIKDKLGFPVRAIEFSLMQRAATSFISQVDREEALKISKIAVRAVIKGKSNNMVVITRIPGPRYKVRFQLKNLRHIANVERKMSAELIKDIHGEGHLMKEYLKPLIDGNVKFVQRDGIIAYARLKKIKI
jgi:6-phosphofructokinase 1